MLTKNRPSSRVDADLQFGWNIAKEMGRLDIGQSVTVRDRTVLAVEAIEGTDACILRTASVCPRGGFSLIKVAKPQQDMRFDLPTIGPRTIDSMNRAGGVAIAIEAGKTILLDRDRTIQETKAAGISIVSLKWAGRSVVVPHFLKVILMQAPLQRKPSRASSARPHLHAWHVLQCREVVGLFQTHSMARSDHQQE